MVKVRTPLWNERFIRLQNAKATLIWYWLQLVQRSLNTYANYWSEFPAGTSDVFLVNSLKKQRQEGKGQLT